MDETTALLKVEKAARILVEGTYSEVVNNTAALVDSLDEVDRIRVEWASASFTPPVEYDPVDDGFAYPIEIGGEG